jgi:hypothetical protein
LWWWWLNINTAVHNRLDSLAMVTARDPCHIHHYEIVNSNDEEGEEDELENIDSTASSSDAEMDIHISIHDVNGVYTIEELNDDDRLTLWNSIIQQALERGSTTITVFSANDDYDEEEPNEDLLDTWRSFTQESVHYQLAVAGNDNHDNDASATVTYEHLSPTVRILQRVSVNDEGVEIEPEEQ